MSSVHSRYLRPQDLDRLRHLVFMPRRPMEGLYAGRHRSAQRGQSVEFADYRPYLPGDPVSDIDWKIYGRSDRLMVRLFEHQTEMHVHVVLDASASMRYLDGKWPTKFDRAASLAAAVGFLVLQQQDRVSLSLAAPRPVFQPLAAGAHQMAPFLEHLEKVRPTGQAALGRTLEELARRQPHRGWVVVLSDLHEPMDPVMRGLERLRSSGCGVLVYQVLHPDEMRLPETGGPVVFTDSESGQKLKIDPGEVQALYQERLAVWLAKWRDLLRARGMEYRLLADPAKDFEVLKHDLRQG